MNKNEAPKSKVQIHFPEGWGAQQWSKRYRAGALPDLWPYGLNRLSSSNAMLELVDVPRLGSLGTTSAIWGRLATRYAKRLEDPSAISLCWEESTALLAMKAFPENRLFSGLIWATDKPEGIRKRAFSRMVRQNLVAADGLWCLSRPQVERAKEWFGSSGPPVSFLPFGIDIDFYPAQVYPQDPLVLSAGGDRDRDTASLFEAFRLVKRAMPAARTVVQTGSNIPPPIGVEVVPRLAHAELRALYGMASVVAVATRPNIHASGMTVALEAMATARPVVITGTPGIEDYVQDGRTGRLVPPNDPERMAESILDILSSRVEAEKLGLNGRARVEREHTTELMAQRLAKIIGISSSGKTVAY